MTVNSYRDLKVWQLGMDIAKGVYDLTRTFPREEVYGLTSQMQRSAVSVPANIAEGHTRATTRDFVRFVGIAHGSLAELETHLLLAEHLGYGDKEKTSRILPLLSEESRMLRALRKSLMAKLK